MSAGHAELVGEMKALENLSMPDRLKHAKKRRAQQLKAYAQYEKQLNKETTKKSKKGGGNASSSLTPSLASRSAAPRLQFDPSILLLEATMRNDVEEVTNLLNSGVDPNVSNEDGLRALHQCSIDNLEEVMRLLIEFGASVNVCDTELWTPLHAAATCGHLNACRYLVEHGAELLAVNSDGNMPYDLCEEPDTLDYIESEMAKRGVTQEMIDDIRLSTENKMLADMKQLKESGGSLEYVGTNGETPLHVAACNGYVYVAEFLLTHGVKVNVVDGDGWMPLHCAACWGQLQLVELLLLHGADFEARTRSGETTLDLCEDIEMKQRVLEVVEEIETKQPMKSKDNNSVKRRNSAARKGSTATAHAMRRTSPHDKSPIAHIEAQEEAARLRESVNSINDDEDEDENFVVLDAITVPPQPSDADKIDLYIEDESPANDAVRSAKSSEQKPVKSIIAKSSQDRASQNRTSSSVPLSSNDIWMTQPHDGSTVASSGKVAIDRTKKNNKESNKAEAKATDKSAKRKDVAEVSSGDILNANQTSGSSSVNQKTSTAVRDIKNEKTSNTKNGKKSQVEVRPSENSVAPTSVDGKHKPKGQTQLDDARNSKVQTSTSSNGTNSSDAALRGSKPVSDPVDPSKSNFVAEEDGGISNAPPTGTLADLKKQRARRLQDTLSSAKENGKFQALSEPSSTNGSVSGSHGQSPRPATTQTSFGSDKPQRHYSGSQEVVDGNERRCCVIL